MSDQTKTRFAVDLDDLERQLRQTTATQPTARASDPLADLARIVGQDDPFKSMFADRRAGLPHPAQVAEASAPPRFQERYEPDLGYGQRKVEPPALMPEPSIFMPARDAEMSRASQVAPPQDLLDEFDRLLQSELRGTTTPTVQAVHDVASAEGARLTSSLDAMDSPREMKGAAAAVPAMTGTGARDLDTFSSRIGADRNVPIGMKQPLAPAEYPEPPTEQALDMRSLEPQQPRKGLVIAGALLGIAALGVGAVVGLRGLSGPVRTQGDPPIIKAEAGPSKVQPQNPGGVEIPNQNKQIYERTPEPKPGEARVVTREEQPIDVQAASSASARVILSGPGATVPAVVTTAPVAASVPAAASTPVVVPAAAPTQVSANPVSPAQSPATALGEPRRVRTIAVRPDGTIAPTAGSTATTALPPPAATPAPRPAAPMVTAAVPAPRPPAPRVVAADETPAPRPVATRTQVAAAPATIPAPAAAPAAAPRPTEPATAGGGFMVQLGAPGSEAEARATFAALQRRHADQLSGDSPVIRRADVANGRTVYRLRVGPFSREEAAEKCQALQAAGGQCFIARN